MISLASIERFCSCLKVTSKEQGVVPLYLYGTQRYFFQEIIRQLAEGIHFFYVLKARQQGVTTACLALDLLWLFTHAGTQGTFVVEEDKKLPNHRTTIEGFLESLPKGLKVPTKTHNRTLIEFRNRSKLLYQVAGTRIKRESKSTFGQSTGVNFVHGTEMSSWADAEAVANFIASLAETNPDRLYIFESTAKGFNDFQERWQDAKDSITKGTIFIGWWRMESYRIRKDDPDANRRLIFQCYGEDPPTGEELMWVDQVKSLYDFQIDQEQLAWWRWKLAEDILDEQLMMQYYPPTEEHAFILSGYRFFDIEKLKTTSVAAKQYQPTYYRYRFGPVYDQTEVYPASDRLAQLTIWDDVDPRGYYVLGADPAFGSSYEADRYVIEVFRCFTNKIVQVAEYCSTEGNCYQFAWMIAHLGGWYRNGLTPSVMVLEINGPGKAVMDEFFRLQQYPQYASPNSKPDLANVVGCINNYLFSRGDSVGGSSYNYHWKTTAELKEYIMNLYRDTYESNQIIIKSPGLIEEMRYIQQSSQGIESGTRMVHDDRVMATALAIEGWKRMMLPELFQVGASYERSLIVAPTADNVEQSVLQWNLENYLRKFRREEELQ
jgi:hypothetical protein